MNPDPVRVVLADDTDDIRLLTRTVLDLDGGFEVVGEASTGTEAVALVRDLSPDVVVLDLAMPEMDGLQALPVIRKESPDTHVVVMSGFERAALGAEAFTLGAAEYVYKGRPLTELVSVLRTITERPPAPMRAFAGGSDTDFLGMVVHDLRSPLTSIRAVADLLAADERVVQDPKIRDLIEIQRRHSALMARLVDDLLTVSRVEGGQLHLSVRPTELAPLLESLTSLQAEDVQLSCPDGLVADADPERVAQIVNNLVSNARQHGVPPVAVSVVRDGPDVVVLGVADAGPGVPDDRVGDLFQRFSPLARGGSGNGLGLYIVRELARAHGGDASYVRASGGNRFEVRLPASSP